MKNRDLETRDFVFFLLHQKSLFTKTKYQHALLLFTRSEKRSKTKESREKSKVKEKNKIREKEKQKQKKKITLGKLRQIRIKRKRIAYTSR